MTLEPKKDGVDDTTNQQVPADKTNDQDPKEGDGANDKVEITKEELEKLKKKATDFDGFVERIRLEKLSGKNKQPEQKTHQEDQQADPVELAKQAAEETVTKLLQKESQGKFEENLAGAYKQFLSDNPWADDDGIMSKVADEFVPSKVFHKEDIIKQLEVTALRLYPEKYKEHIKSQIKAEVLADVANNNAGAGGGGVSIPQGLKPDVVVTDEDKKIADKFFGGDIQRYLKVKKS